MNTDPTKEQEAGYLKMAIKLRLSRRATRSHNKVKQAVKSTQGARIFATDSAGGPRGNAKSQHRKVKNSKYRGEEVEGKKKTKRMSVQHSSKLLD
jgi:hypothetical protein